VFRLPTRDLPAFAWREPFVEGLCDDHGLNNPFDDAQSIGIADTIIANTSDEHYDESGEHISAVVSTDAGYDFIRRVRFISGRL
jgi:hypothetical protein